MLPNIYAFPCHLFISWPKEVRYPDKRLGVIGAFIGFQVVGQMADKAPFLRPLLYAYFAFVLLTWLSPSFFNLLLRLDRFGRYALSADQVRGANVAGEQMLTETLAKSGIKLVPVETNPIDALWEDRPKPSAAPIAPHGVEYSGRIAKDKILDVQDVLRQDTIDAVLLTMLDSIAWLFNVRGGDIRHTPVALAYALVPANGRPTRASCEGG